LGILQATVSLAPSSVQVSNNSASYATRQPALPVELNGVSVSIAGAACGLYSVSPSQINFVVPKGLPPSTGGSYVLIINNNGTVIRGLLVIVTAQPDIFTTTPPGPGGRAAVCNITNPMTMGCIMEPFNITTDDGTGTLQPTVLEMKVTGIRGRLPASVTVTVGTTAIIAGKVFSLDQPGFDQIDFTLPSNVSTGDVPVVVTVGTATSRTTDTAPHIFIIPGPSPTPSPTP
jgi:uncharacterized protein (TIGR03437 family)